MQSLRRSAIGRPCRAFVAVSASSRGTRLWPGNKGLASGRRAGRSCGVLFSHSQPGQGGFRTEKLCEQVVYIDVGAGLEQRRQVVSDKYAQNLLIVRAVSLFSQQLFAQACQ